MPKEHPCATADDGRPFGKESEMFTTRLTRRALLTGVAASPALIRLRPARAEALPNVVVRKDPDCGCCGGWVDHMRAAGFSLEVIETAEVNRVKVRLGVPQDLASCHTAEVGGYVLEGHVPADAVKRLLAERPKAERPRSAGHAGGLSRDGGGRRRTRHVRGRAFRTRGALELCAVPGRASAMSRARPSAPRGWRTHA
jgi:hypothetical protein